MLRLHAATEREQHAGEAQKCMKHVVKVSPGIITFWKMCYMRFCCRRHICRTSFSCKDGWIFSSHNKQKNKQQPNLVDDNVKSHL